METKSKSDLVVKGNEMNVTRLINAPCELVFEMWTNPEHIKHWWGPTGFTNTIYKMDFKEGGEWDFTMHGPNGMDYRNTNRFVKIVKNEKIILEHTGPPVFKMTALFKAEGKKTLLSITSQFESAELLKKVIEEFGAAEGLKQNVDKLEAYVANLPAEKELTITRTLNAPRNIVWKAWTDEKQLQQWWGPKGFTNPVCEWNAKVGNTLLIHMKAPDGMIYPMDGKFSEVVEPEKIVFLSAALDKEGKRLFEVTNTILFTKEGSKTKLTLHFTFHNIKPEGAAHIKGAETGWNMSLDKLVTFLSKSK